MKRYIPLLLFALPAQAHETHDPHSAKAQIIPAAVEQSIVKMTKNDTYRYIRSNGIPNHKTGSFPNRNNPNSISSQSHNYRVTLAPQKNNQTKPQNGLIGIALNGIPFEPGTAECYGQRRGSRPNPNCKWKEEAIVNGRGYLGLDSSNAHVQPNGTYHYHGIPHGLLNILPNNDLTHIGYAADGFKIYTSRSNTYKPSYQLKSGTRPDGPGGIYTGKYTADFEYKTGLGELDECNGMTINNEYAYFITESFPFAPRCLQGTADSSFQKRSNPTQQGGNTRQNRRPPPGHRPPPHLR